MPTAGVQGPQLCSIVVTKQIQYSGTVSTTFLGVDVLFYLLWGLYIIYSSNMLFIFVRILQECLITGGGRGKLQVNASGTKASCDEQSVQCPWVPRSFLGAWCMGG